jgi:hypothetical protein
VIDNFCVFILSHNRHDRVYTYNTLREKNYTGKIFIIIDDEDKSHNKYIETYGSQVITFSKDEVAKTFDIGDSFDDKRAVVFARNACFNIAKKLGYTYFMQLDDDYTDFRWSFDNDKKYVTNKYIKNLDKIFEIMLDFYKKTFFTSICMAQGGDFIGGENSGLSKTYLDGQISRKIMNSFLCSVDRPFQFVGRINEDVNTYTSLGSRGDLFFTIPNVKIAQQTTQKNKGGMTELYLDNGTYIKSFYTIMFNPSSVRISEMGEKNRRIHHHISWNNTVPCILNEKYKK